MSIPNRQIGESQESRLWWEVLKQFNKLEETVGGHMGKRIHTPDSQIGWGAREYLLRQIAKKIASITQLRCSQDSCITTTTTTSSTTTLPPTSTLRIIPENSDTFDISKYTGGTDSDFTIEWLQYMHTDDNFPRVYSIGQYPAQNAVSIENDTLYLWLDGAMAAYSYLPSSFGPYLDMWVHIVVTRFADNLFVWMNDTPIITIAYTNAIPTNGLDFYIGSENAPNTYYNGLISNFRWTKSEAVYGPYPPTYPTEPFVTPSNTILLIGVGNNLTSQLTDQVGINTITNTSCTYNTDSGIPGYDGSLQFGTV
jgi:hypothetical protein